MSKRKKIILLVIIFVLFILLILAVGALWTMHETRQGERENEKYGIKTSVSNVTPTSLELTTNCSKKPNNEDLQFGVGFYIEKWQLFGWKELPYPEEGVLYDSNLMTRYIVGTNVLQLDWKEIYGELSSGTYRIKVPIYDKYIPDFDRQKPEGYCYTVFEVK